MRSPENPRRRLRLLIAILLAAAALISAAATVKDRLHLEVGVSLTVLLTVLAVLAPLAQGWLKQAQALLDRQDQKEEGRAKALADRARRDVLEQVRQGWVRPELHGSLYAQARIELGLAERPAAVDNPLRAVLRRPDEPDRLLEPGQPIAQVYRQLGRQLLILGEPGAGKTTLLMELTDQLLKEAERAPEQPMPVVFHLSTWPVERRPVVEWLVDELYKRYGVPRRLGRMWIGADQVIPLLDGLDEVATDHRDACAAAINAFHDEHGQSPLAVCSRVTEYEALRAKLRLRGAIVIQPLTPVEVDQYLRQAGRALAGVRTALRDDNQLAELLTTPLFLSIVALTYKDKAAADVRASVTTEERRQRVLADYVTAMLARPQPSAALQHYAPEQTVGWLAWLAAAMGAHGQSVFYIDWMQPDWLPTQKQRRFVTIGTALAAGLSFLLTFAVISIVFPEAILSLLSGQPTQYQVYGLILALPMSLLVGLVAYHPTIVPTERLRWTAASLRRNFHRWFVRSALSVLGIWLCLLFVSSLNVGVTVIASVDWQGATLLGRWVQGGPWPGPRLAIWLIDVLSPGVIPALSVGLVFGLLSGLQTQSYVSPPGPGKAIRVSGRNALLNGLPIGLGVGVIGALSAGLREGLPSRNWYAYAPIVAGVGVIAVLLAVPVAVIVGLLRGGGAYIRHHLLRWLLVRNRSIPRHYIAFLNYATRLILLRRRGGGYEFVHHLLLEHFAALEPPSRHARASPGVSQGSPATAAPESAARTRRSAERG